MKFKMIWILSLILFAALALSAVSAADSNATDDMIGMENAQDSDAISLEHSDDEQASDDESNQSENSDAQSNDLLGKSNDNEVVLTSADDSPILAASTIAPAKLTATKTTPTKLKATKKSTYAFKGKSKFKWKIKKSTWKKMKKQAVKQYKKLHSYGSSLPGYSNGVKVIAIKNGHKYRGTAFAVKNYRGIRCEVRGLPNGLRATTWGDYYP